MLTPPDDPLWEARLVPDPPRSAPPVVAMPRRIWRTDTGNAGPADTRAVSRGESRAACWRRCAPGWVVDSRADPAAPGQRVVEAIIDLRPGEAVTGWTSLFLAGAPYLEGTTLKGALLPVTVLVKRTRRRRVGVTWSRASVTADEIVIRHGIPCTNIHRALLDELCDSPDLRQAVVVIDMVLHAELTSLRRFGAYLRSAPRRRGLRQARRAFALAVEGSQSPRETEMRLVWVLDAGLPAPLCNRPIYSHDGRFIARPDLLSPDLAVVGEYDGEHHRDTRRRGRDIGREGRLRNVGLEVFSFVGGELGNRSAAVTRVHEAVARARQASLPQRWTLTPPARATNATLDERLEARELMLLHRRGRAAVAELSRDTPSSAPEVG